MKHLSILIIVFFASIVGCDEINYLGCDSITKIHVSKSNFLIQSRAVENDYSTLFEKNDRIGVIGIDKNGNLLKDCKNIPFTYDGSKWNIHEGMTLYYYTGATYIVYYPYSLEMDSETTIEGIKSAFRPQTDQSTKEAYTNSDLMIGTAKAAGATLNVNLKHVMSLVEMQYPLSSTNPTFFIDNIGFSPYSMGNGKYRYIVAPTKKISLLGSYSINGKTIEFTKELLPVGGQYLHLDITYPNAPVQ